MITLGIETSCDETALALVETRGKECRVMGSLVHSQADLHSAYGGVYPNLAKREHGRNLVPLLHKLLLESQIDTRGSMDPDKFSDILSRSKDDLQSQNPDLWESLSGADFLRNIPTIDRIAVTEGPGLEPTLWVGINFAKVLSALWDVPVTAVNHMEGHIIGSLLESDKPSDSWQRLIDVNFPAIALLISGGHTELVRIDPGRVDIRESTDLNDSVNNDDGIFKYTILGQTLDDAVGEAFDKVARLLGLPYPGGPHISELSEKARKSGTPSVVKLPRPMKNSGDLNFSFSGLKTAVLYATRKFTSPDGTLPEDFKQGMAYGFELAVTETLDFKLRQAIEKIGAKTIIVGGGVSANKMLGERFGKTAGEYNIPLYLPSRHVSGDNALMIALAGAMDQTSHSSIPITKLRADGTKRLGTRR